MTGPDAWSLVCSYGGSLKSSDRRILSAIKEHDKTTPVAYLVLSKQVLCGDQPSEKPNQSSLVPSTEISTKLSDPIGWILALNKDRLYKMIQFFPIHACLTVENQHHCGSQENVYAPTSEIYDPEFLIFYFIIILRYHLSDFSLDSKFLRSFVASGCFPVLLTMLSSECPMIREGAFQCLDIFSKRIFSLPNELDDNFREMRLIRWLCTLAQNLVTESARKAQTAQLAPIVARFISEAALVIVKGSKSYPNLLCSDVIRFIISYHSSVASDDLPIFNIFWFSSQPEFIIFRRSFCLKMLRQGMKNEKDALIFAKRNIIQHLLTHLVSISAASALVDAVAILECFQSSVKFGGELIAVKLIKEFLVYPNLFVFFAHMLPAICVDDNELTRLCKATAVGILKQLDISLQNEHNFASSSERQTFKLQHTMVQKTLDA